ncbi:MAG: trypsin-like serine protease [Terricaulis sp.]
MMRILAAAAIIALSVLVALMASANSGLSSFQSVTAFTSLATDKQTNGVKPTRRGNDSCRWANDNECDDPDIGTGACRLGTDDSDCRALRNGENDSCRWARDGECDEPNFGTGACVQGTDRTDCGQISWMRNQSDSCTTALNDVCEEPGHANGSCAASTDRADCHGRDRPLTINDHFFGHDDRVRVNARELPWRFMGRFVNGAGEACTATLIARDVIVTAAHCIHTDHGIQAGGVFTAESGGAEARTIAYAINPRFNYQQFSNGDEIDGLDWSLLRLDQPLGERLGFAGVRSITSQDRTALRAIDLYQAGYSWDTGDTLSANVRCHMIEAFNDHTFSHQCDTTRGDSGSALLVQSEQSFDVIGVDSSFRNNPNGPVINIAVSASSFLPHVADFIAGRTGTPTSGNGGKPKRDE